MASKGLYLGAAVLLLGAGAYFLLPWQSGSSAASEDYVFEKATVERGDVQRIVSASGAVRATQMVDVGSEISGKVIELNTDFNDRVEANQLLAKIDPQNYVSRVNQNKALLTSSRASLEIQMATISKSEATLDNAQRAFARQSRLYEQQAISQSLLEDTKRQLDIAKADVILNKAQMARAKADIVQKQANLVEAQADLERTNIRSPIEGVVIVRNIELGQTVAASFSAPLLFQIAQDLSDIRIDAAVVEADIGTVNAGDVVKFTVDAYPDDTFDGVVEQVRLQAETLQNVVTYTVVIAAKNPGNILLPGMTANVEIIADQRKDVLRLKDNVLRFTPPSGLVAQAGDDGEAAGNGGMGNRGERGAGRDARPSAIANIEMDAGRKAQAEAALSEELAKMRQSFGGGNAGGGNGGGGFGGGGDREATQLREQIRKQTALATERVLKAHLNSDELDQWRVSVRQAAQTRAVNVYKITSDQEVSASRLTIGLADDEYIEIIRGAQEGDEFVIRATAGEAQ